jgi:ferrous iron transport protein A
MSVRKRLGELNKGQAGRILSVGSSSAPFTRRLLEMGLLEGAVVELIHEAPFGGDPVAVRVRGALIALRRNEANQIEVELLS